MVDKYYGMLQRGIWQKRTLLDIPPDCRAEGGDAVGLLKLIISYLIIALYEPRDSDK